MHPIPVPTSAILRSGGPSLLPAVPRYQSSTIWMSDSVAVRGISVEASTLKERPKKSAFPTRYWTGSRAAAWNQSRSQSPFGCGGGTIGIGVQIDVGPTDHMDQSILATSVGLWTCCRSRWRVIHSRRRRVVEASSLIGFTSCTIPLYCSIMNGHRCVDTMSLSDEVLDQGGDHEHACVDAWVEFPVHHGWAGNGLRPHVHWTIRCRGPLRPSGTNRSGSGQPSASGQPGHADPRPETISPEDTSNTEELVSDHQAPEPSADVVVPDRTRR